MDFDVDPDASFDQKPPPMPMVKPTKSPKKEPKPKLAEGKVPFTRPAKKGETALKNLLPYKPRKHILVLQSPYEGRPITCFFPYPEECERTRDESRVLYPEKVKDRKYPRAVYRLPAKNTYPHIRKMFELAGFKVTKSN